jgi:hypothetical protein
MRHLAVPAFEDRFVGWVDPGYRTLFEELERRLRAGAVVAALSWWTERERADRRRATVQPSDELAYGLVTALGRGRDTIRERQRFVAEAIARL